MVPGALPEFIYLQKGGIQTKKNLIWTICIKYKDLP